MLNNKKIRISIGVIVLIVLVFALAPKFYLFNSADGVVNGRILTIRSPIAGDLTFSQKLDYGSFVGKGETIGVVTNNRVNNSLLYELQTEKNTLTARISSLEAKITTFKALGVSLEKNIKKHQTFAQKQVELQIEQEQQLLAEELTENKRAKAEYKSSHYLNKQNAIGERELEKHEAAALGSDARLIKIKSHLAEFANSLAAIKTGVFLDYGNNDSPYSKQRLDQLVMELSSTEAVYNEARNRLVGIDKQIIEEEQRISRMQKYKIIAPADVLVWRMPASTGSSMRIGSEIIVLFDCNTVFLDIAVSESESENIEPGTEITFHLIGQTKLHPGVVLNARGSGIAQGDTSFASSLKKDPKKEFRIWIKIDIPDIAMKTKVFPQIGRRVVVRFPRKWSHWNFIEKFTRIF